MVSGGQHLAQAFLGEPESEEYIGVGQGIHTPQQPAAHRVKPAVWRFAWVDGDQQSNLRWSAEQGGDRVNPTIQNNEWRFFDSYKRQTRLTDEDVLDLQNMDAIITSYLRGGGRQNG